MSCKSVTTCFIVELEPTDTEFSRSSEYQQEIDELLAADTENKKWEKIYLEEIRIAQENFDQDAYMFFIKEYISIPRLQIPEWMQSEPGYVPREKIQDIH